MLGPDEFPHGRTLLPFVVSKHTYKLKFPQFQYLAQTSAICASGPQTLCGADVESSNSHSLYVSHAALERTWQALTVLRPRVNGVLEIKSDAKRRPCSRPQSALG